MSGNMTDQPLRNVAQGPAGFARTQRSRRWPGAPTNRAAELSIRGSAIPNGWKAGHLQSHALKYTLWNQANDEHNPEPEKGDVDDIPSLSQGRVDTVTHP